MTRPRRLDMRGERPEDLDLRPVVDHLRAGGLLAYPTETVYGFGCRLEASALRRLQALKPREPDRPFLLLVPHLRTVEELAWTDEARELARVFWPGSVTLVLSDPRGVFPPGVRSLAGTVAVRMSSHPVARRLVELLGEPLTSTSANVPGEPPATDGEAAAAAATFLGAGEETWVLEVGPLPESTSSTIVDCTGEVPRVRRAGATPVRRLRCVLPEIET